MKLKVEIQELMAQGNIDKVVSLILNLKSDSSIKNEIIIISSRWENLKRDNRRGIIPKSSFDQESNTILVAIQELVNQSDFFAQKRPAPPWPIFAIIVGFSIFVVVILIFLLLGNPDLKDKGTGSFPGTGQATDTLGRNREKGINYSGGEIKSTPQKARKLPKKDSFEVKGYIIDSLGTGIDGVEIRINDSLCGKSQGNGSFKFSLLSNGKKDYKMQIFKYGVVERYYSFQPGDAIEIILPPNSNQK